MIDPLPFGGEVILSHRLRNLAPELVLVSTLGLGVNFDSGDCALVKCLAQKKYDWRFLKNIPVFLLCQSIRGHADLLQDMCRIASSVKAFFVDQQAGYDVWFFPLDETLHLPPKSWTYRLELAPCESALSRSWGIWVSEGLNV